MTSEISNLSALKRTVEGQIGTGVAGVGTCRLTGGPQIDLHRLEDMAKTDIVSWQGIPILYQLVVYRKLPEI